MPEFGQKLHQASDSIHQVSENIADKIRFINIVIRRGSSKITDVEFVEENLERGVNTFIIVADSAWAPIDQRLMDLESEGKVNRWVMPSEGSIPPAAVGKWFATGQLSNMMMQNTGFSNATEYIRSIMIVHKIPGLLTEGWRGYKFEGSEPHDLVGEVTDKDNRNVFSKEDIFGHRSGIGLGIDLRKALDRANEGDLGHLVCVRLAPAPDGFRKTVQLRKIDPGEISYADMDYYNAIKAAKGKPFEEVQAARRMHPDDAMRYIVASYSEDTFYFVYNGYGARRFQGLNLTENCFENAGGMGSALAMAWAAAKSNPEQRFVAIDGDQNALMSEMDKIVCSDFPENLYWKILNSGSGDSVGRALSPALPPWYYDLAEVINVENMDPNEPFPYPRVGARGLKFRTQAALDLASEIGELPAVAWLGRKRLIEMQAIRDVKKREYVWSAQGLIDAGRLPQL